LQLQQPRNDNPIMVNCHAIVPGQNSVLYAMESFHNSIYKDNSLSSTIKDPVVALYLTDVANNQSIFCHLPLKYCYNLTNGSKLQIIHQHYYPWFDEAKDRTAKHLLIDAICQKNPNLPGNSFAEQMNVAKNIFYQNPG